MPLLQEKKPDEKKPDAAAGSPRVPKHRSALRRRYRALLTLLTLLGLVGKTLLIDTKAVDALMQMVKHLHLFGF